MSRERFSPEQIVVMLREAERLIIFDPITYYGPEFVAHAVRSWLTAIDVNTLYIEPGSRWKNGSEGPNRGPATGIQPLQTALFPRLQAAGTGDQLA